jgi:cell division protein FtsW
MWAVLGVRYGAGDADRLPPLSRADVHLDQSGVRGVRAGAVYFAPVDGARRCSASAASACNIGLLKLIAIFIAALLERRMHRIDEVTYSLLPIGIVVLGLVALILPEPDFGTSMAILMITAVMIFAAGLNWRYIVGAALVALPAIYLVVMGSAYRRRRTLAFLNPWDDPLGDGFQIIQSLIAIGTGGVWGKGLMNGVQKLFYLPEPHTDFIYSVISEELGLVGATAVVICFCVVTWRGMRVALRAPDTFGSFLALGLTTMVAVQAFVNISVVLGLMPTKGIPLPFVSAGGSSLLINLVGMGILLNVSQHASTGA